MESLQAKKRRAAFLFETLDPLYGREKTALRYRNPFELLIATILSAQCTDERVNQVTKNLFEKYRSPQDFLDIPSSRLEEEIRPTGFFRNKAKAIQGVSRGLVDRYGGEVPSSMEALVELPGIGRKTANVVLGAAFDVPGVVVDTHVKRLSGRLGLTGQKDPDKIERELQDLLPQGRWRRFSDLLIYHGREVCKARKPDHGRCAVFDLCPSNSI
jgi:endonuclease III